MARRITASVTGPRPVMTMWPAVPTGSFPGARLCSRHVIQGRNTNWMNANGSRTRMKRAPLRSTTIEKMRPASPSKVMSPKPSVDIVVSVQ